MRSHCTNSAIRDLSLWLTLGMTVHFSLRNDTGLSLMPIIVIFWHARISMLSASVYQAACIAQLQLMPCNPEGTLLSRSLSL